MEAEKKMEAPANEDKKMEAVAADEEEKTEAPSGEDKKVEADVNEGKKIEAGANEKNMEAASSEKKVEAVKECPFTLITFTDLPPAHIALKKLSDSNSAYDQEFKLNIEELAAIETVMRNPQCAMSDVHFCAFERGLKWGLDDLAPIMHTLAVGLLNEVFNAEMCSKRGTQLFERLVNIVASDPKDNIAILVMRAFANMASHKDGRKLLQRDVCLLCDLALKHIQNPNMKLQIASACVLANITLILWTSTEVEKVAELGPREDVVRSFINNFESNFNFELSQPALILLLQAIATAMWGDKSIIALARNLFMQRYVDAIKDKVPDEAGKSLARDINEMMHSVD